MYFLWYPLGCALIYPVATLLLKQVMVESGGPWKVTFVSNLTMALLFLPLLLLGHPLRQGAAWWQPFLGGACFFGGQIFTFLSLSKGDASVATPLLGTKVIFVAFFSIVFLQQPIPLAWWLAAGLTSLALVLLGKSSRTPAKSHAHGPTVFCAISSAFCFAMTDVFTQKYTPAWSFPEFAPRMFGTSALLSFGLIPFFSSSSQGKLGASWGRLLGAAFLLAVQALGMCYVLGTYGQATAVNVVYNSRGIFSILLIWSLGHWFGNREREIGRQVMAWRMAGAILLLSAIGLIVVAKN